MTCLPPAVVAWSKVNLPWIAHQYGHLPFVSDPILSLWGPSQGCTPVVFVTLLSVRNLTICGILVSAYVILSLSSSTSTCDYPLPSCLSPFFPFNPPPPPPPSIFFFFWRRWQRTNSVFVCPHSRTRDGLGWPRRRRVLKGSGGGLQQTGLPKTDYTSLLFLQMPGHRKSSQEKEKKESRPSRESRRQIFVRVKHCCFLPFVWQMPGRETQKEFKEPDYRINERWIVFLVIDNWFSVVNFVCVCWFWVARLVGPHGQHFIIFKSSFDLCSCSTKRTRGVINPPLPHLFLDYL